MKKYEYKGDFWHRVSSSRALLSLTQKELAELTGVSQRQIAAYETATSYPREAVLHRLAQALGTTPEWLATGEGQSRIKARVSPAEISLRIPLIKIEEVVDFLFGNKKDFVVKAWYPTTIRGSELAFALLVDDEAMASSDDEGYGFPKGSIVTFEPCIEAQNGDFVLAVQHDGKCTFRQLFKGMRSATLTPLDSKYPQDPITFGEIDTKEIWLCPAVSVETFLPARSRLWDVHGSFKTIPLG